MQIITDAINRSISHTERVHVEVEDLQAAIAAAREAWEGEVDYTDESDGSLDVWGAPIGESDTEEMAWRLRVSRALQVGDTIEAGRGEDRDYGRVVALDGDSVTVAWRGALCQTTQPIEALEDLEVLGS